VYSLRLDRQDQKLRAESKAARLTVACGMAEMVVKECRRVTERLLPRVEGGIIVDAWGQREGGG